MSVKNMDAATNTVVKGALKGETILEADLEARTAGENLVIVSENGDDWAIPVSKEYFEDVRELVADRGWVKAYFGYNSRVGGKEQLKAIYVY